jgi:flagellar basal-body rod protein FlgG
MMRALTTAATGLDAQAATIERISTDLANANTTGYKKGRTDFQELMYETIKEPGAALGAATNSPTGIQAGTGVKVGSQYKIFEQGASQVTTHPYDLMIEGRGFFPVQMPNGEIGYSRAGNFHLDAQGRMMLSNGATIVPPIAIPPNSVGVSISPNGEVKSTQPGGQESTIGQIQLISFTNEQGLLASGGGLYRPTPGSGQPIQGIPGENGLGTIQQGALEASNVNVAASMVDMIGAQRTYEINTKVMKAADEMLAATANIK